MAAINGKQKMATTVDGGGGVQVGGPAKTTVQPPPKSVTPIAAAPVTAKAPTATGSTIANTPGTPGAGAQGATNAANAAQVAAASTPVGATAGNGSSTNPNNINGWNQGTTDPLTGMMAQFGYTPQGLGNLYGSPSQLANDVLGTLGIDNAGLASQLGDYMNPALFANLILNGARGSTLNDNDALNFVANYMQQMATPGGRTPQLDVLINDIMKAGSAQGTPLYDYFNYDPSSGAALTPADQVKYGNQAMGQAMTSMNPLAQRAYAAYVAKAGQDYQNALNKGQNVGPNYLSYLQQSGLPGYIRRG